MGGADEQKVRARGFIEGAGSGLGASAEKPCRVSVA